jgi:hypothetical protein
MKKEIILFSLFVMPLVTLQMNASNAHIECVRWGTRTRCPVDNTPYVIDETNGVNITSNGRVVNLVVQITDMNDNIVYSNTIQTIEPDEVFNIDMTIFPKGIYNLRMSQNDNYVLYSINND